MMPTACLVKISSLVEMLTRHSEMEILLRFMAIVSICLLLLCTRFGQYFEVEVQARFLSWSLVSSLLLMSG